MKGIFYCPTEREFLKRMEDVEFPRWVPYSSIVIDYDKSLYQKLDNLSVVGRLSQIKQLGIADRCTELFCASQTRYGHSLILATNADRISQERGFDRNLAVIAAMTHDIGTPPFSDSVADAIGIKDEDRYESMIESCPEAKKLLRDYSVSKKELTKIVRGEDRGPVGQLISRKNCLELDKLSYVLSDADLTNKTPKAWFGNYYPNPFKSFEMINGEIIFTDIESVKQLLEARTKMFEQVYRNPNLRAKEAFMGDMVMDLTKKGMITSDSVFDMVDYDFECLAKKNCGELAHKVFGYDGFECYGMAEATEGDLHEFISSRTRRPFSIKKHKAVNPAIETPVMVNGDVKPYREWEPFHAKGIELRLSAWRNTNIYGFENDRELESVTYEAIRHFGGSEDDLEERNALEMSKALLEEAKETFK